MSIDLINRSWEAKGLTSAQRLVLICLCDHFNEDEGRAWPSMARIAAFCHISEQMASRHIKSIEESGYLSVDRSTPRSNHYRITLPEKGETLPFRKKNTPIGSDGGEETTPVANDTPPPSESRGVPPSLCTDTPVINDTQTIKEPLKEPLKNVQEDARDLEQDLMDWWNSLAGDLGLSQIIKITPKRRKGIKQRGADLWDARHTIEQEIRGSPFLQGRVKNWRVDFDFIACTTDGVSKILEGKYRDSPNQKTNGKHSNDEAVRELLSELRYGD